MAALFSALAASAAAQEIPVSDPRIVLPPGRRLDGALSSDGKTVIAAWNAKRSAEAIFTSRLRSHYRVLDPYGLRIEAPADHYVDQPAVAIGADSTLVAMRFWNRDGHAVAVVRVIDGKLEAQPKIIASGCATPAAASNGATFLVACAGRKSVEVMLLSPQLEVIEKKTIDGAFPRVAANGERYLVTFNDQSPYPNGRTALRGLIVEGQTIGEPFQIAANTEQGAALAAAGDSWAVALKTTAIELCAVKADGSVACREIARSETHSYVSEVVAATDAVIVAWHAERPIRYATPPPLVMYELKLTRVTQNAETAIGTTPDALPADDDSFLFASGEAMRVGRRGLVTYIPLFVSAPAQSLPYMLLPSGDGATAFWSEVTAAGDAMELHATRFTSGGRDPKLLDRVYGRLAHALASDGTNILLSDGRIIDPTGNVVRKIELPAETSLAAWDGQRWIFVTANGVVHRDRETRRVSAASPNALVCAAGNCIFTWVQWAERAAYRIDVRALHIVTGRPLSRARNLLLATDIAEHQVIGAAAAGGAILVTWSNQRSRVIEGRIFDARGRMGETFVLARPVNAGDPLFFKTASGADAFLLSQNAWPMTRLLRIGPSGKVVSTVDVKTDGSVRGLVDLEDRTVVFYERAAPEPPFQTSARGFVQLTPRPPAPHP